MNFFATTKYFLYMSISFLEHIYMYFYDVSFFERSQQQHSRFYSLKCYEKARAEGETILSRFIDYIAVTIALHDITDHDSCGTNIVYSYID